VPPSERHASGRLPGSSRRGWCCDRCDSAPNRSSRQPPAAQKATPAKDTESCERCRRHHPATCTRGSAQPRGTRCIRPWNALSSCADVVVAVAIPRTGHHGDNSPIGAVVSRIRDARDTRTPRSLFPSEFHALPAQSRSSAASFRRTGVVARGADNETTTDVRSCQSGFLGPWLRRFGCRRAGQAARRTE
jgi:hypothetical protein